MNWFLKWWRDLWTSTETALLRAENKRLRETCLVLEDESEALRKDLRSAVNNLLSEAGATPLPPHENVKPAERKMAHRRLSWQQKQRIYALETKPVTPVKEIA
jgi:hypothetical protein